jgi:multiple sugar transport system substrate-binding protein
MDSTTRGRRLRANTITRRDLVRGIGAAGFGAAVAASYGQNSWAQSRAPITISVWSNDQPQQRGWYQRCAKLFMERKPNVKVDYQWFPFGELGKKVSVAYATGTAPDAFVCYDWFMPVWLDKKLLAPLDVQRLGYSSIDAFRADHAPAAVASVAEDGKVYGMPTWFYAFSNYINEKHFREAGLDPDKDAPRTWKQFGEIAQRLTVRQGNKIVRQGAKFAMHAAQWTMIQFNPILLQCGGAWFDREGKCTVNNAAGLEAMRIRASLVREYGAEDPADTVATNPLPQMDFLRERSSMFLTHPVPPAAIESQNKPMFAEAYYRPIDYPGVEAGKGFATTYGFNLVINAQASAAKQEALHEFFTFFMSDLVELWKNTAPFGVGRKAGWTEHPDVKSFPHVDQVLQATSQGAFLPRTLVYNELADAMHRAVQQIMLNNGDIKENLDRAAADVDRATAAYRRA